MYTSETDPFGRRQVYYGREGAQSGTRRPLAPYPAHNGSLDSFGSFADDTRYHAAGQRRYGSDRHMPQIHKPGIQNERYPVTGARQQHSRRRHDKHMNNTKSLEGAPYQPNSLKPVFERDLGYSSDSSLYPKNSKTSKKPNKYASQWNTKSADNTPSSSISHSSNHVNNDTVIGGIPLNTDQKDKYSLPQIKENTDINNGSDQTQTPNGTANGHVTTGGKPVTGILRPPSSDTLRTSATSDRKNNVTIEAPEVSCRDRCMKPCRGTAFFKYFCVVIFLALVAFIIFAIVTTVTGQWDTFGTEGEVPQNTTAAASVVI